MNLLPGAVQKEAFITSEPEFPHPYPGSPLVHFWVETATGQKHGLRPSGLGFQFRSSAVLAAENNGFKVTNK
jgi:hypothetical protein